MTAPSRPMALPLAIASPIRLALFTDTYTPQVNGVARTLERLVHALRLRGGAVRVFTVSDPHAAPTAHVRRAASRPFWAYPELQLAWPNHADIVAQLAEFRPTLVHVATEFGIGLAGRRAARALGVPLVSSYHTSFSAYATHYGLGALAQPGWQYLRWFHGASRRTWCPTQAIVDELTQRGFRRCSVWSRGVDGDRFSPRFRSAGLRAMMGAADDTIVLTYVGRLAAEKGVDVLLEAYRLAADANPERVKLLIVGDGPHAASLRARAPAGTHFTGRLEGQPLSEAYASGDVFLFPSTTDTFGNVMLEAMASGLPVIGADVGPTREVLAPDRGWLVRPDDPRAMAQVVSRLLADRLLLRRRRASALAHARAQCWEAIWDRLFDEYLALQGGTHVA